MTPRTSVRAATRAIYSNMRGRDLVLGLAPEVGQGVPRKVDFAAPSDALAQEPPLPNPLPAWERGSSEFLESAVQESAPTPDPSPLLADAHGGGEEVDLMTRVRALYEDSAVPVREIARLCGVTERTLYKYVAKGKWRRRYAVKPRGKEAAAANRGRRWQRAKGHESAKGAGGRFIARAEAGKPVARGLKALDPRGRARADAACAAAAARHDAAREEAERWQVMDARCRALDILNRRLDAYQRYRDKQAKFMEASYPDAAANIEAFHSDELADSLRQLQRLRE